jgi:hypothetical protein
MKYIRTKDGRIKEIVILDINNIESVENLWCEFHFDNGILRFVDYFPKEKQTLEILQIELKNFVFVKEKANSDYYDYNYKPIKKEEILRQSDTIEELCDEFVIKTDKEYISKRSLLELQDMNNYVPYIYGAIWTDKGLIYVAKMKGILPNGEIDWELL